MFRASTFPRRRRNEQRDSRQQQHARLDAGVGRVELLHPVPQAAEQERAAHHEQTVRHDRARHRCLYQIQHAGAQRRDGDHQFGEVAERGIEQAAHGITVLAATPSVAWLSKPASGTMARTDSRNRACRRPGSSAPSPAPPARTQQPVERCLHQLPGNGCHGRILTLEGSAYTPSRRASARRTRGGLNSPPTAASRWDRQRQFQESHAARRQFVHRADQLQHAFGHSRLRLPVCRAAGASTSARWPRRRRPSRASARPGRIDRAGPARCSRGATQCASRSRGAAR